MIVFLVLLMHLVTLGCFPTVVFRMTRVIVLHHCAFEMYAFFTFAEYKLDGMWHILFLPSCVFIFSSRGDKALLPNIRISTRF